MISATSPSTLAEVDQSVLAELPPEIQNEVLASLRADVSAFCILDDETDDDDSILPDSEAFRHAAASAKAKILSVLKATNVKNEELLHSASAALHKVQVSASKQLQQLSDKLSPRAASAKVPSFTSSAVPSSDVSLELAALRTDLKSPVRPMSPSYLTRSLQCVPGDEVYESLLHHLWTALAEVTDATSFEREGEGWMAIGFQRINPDTDFRGGGLLALKCLVYACNMHPEKMLFLFRDQKPEQGKRWYPVSVAGINLTCLLAGLLKSWGVLADN
ncbi:hypothetical protein DYB31_010273 [Aphanomyces astaci]|uniref:ELMO domain-containing protein n=2 Tax=Aphanomyces astaci TaxID=112090 RepID=A0A397EUX6_APHAT|nr:hypothetical protein DYB31_010273 [Aphanomyces astaci]